MSTKCYQGARCPIEYWPKNVLALRNNVHELIRANLSKWLKPVNNSDDFDELYSALYDHYHRKEGALYELTTAWAQVWVSDLYVYMNLSRWAWEVAKKSGIDEYVYWNNVDALDTIDPNEWFERGRVWDELLTFAPVGHFLIEFTRQPDAFHFVMEYVNKCREASRKSS